VISRRAFGLTVAGLAISARARADEPVDGEEAHPIEPPPALEFRTMTWSKSSFFYDGNTTAIVGVPRDLAPGARLPMVILLPGGHHNMQRHDKGCWGWWSEYRLGEIDAALRRGTLNEKDFRLLGRANEIELFNEYLATTPYRGAILVTPWVVGRQLDPAPHGAMVAAFLRDLVARAREELPVLATRDATGLGGMSSGGLWALHAGSTCSDLFGTVVATQPFTEELVKPLRAAVTSRVHAQKLRIVTSVDDHQRKSTVELSQALVSDHIEHELIEYLGAHSAGFAAGPGGLDALLSFDRYLRGEQLDGTRPLPSHDGLSAAISVDDTPRRNPADASDGPKNRFSPTWPLLAIGAATAGAATMMLRRREN
jgi:iron(III)-salmochelin esterase